MSEAMKRAFADALASVRSLVERGTPVDDVLAAHTAAVDEIMRRAFAAALSNADRDAGAGIALVALGSYGRRELAPASDLDLLLIHRGWKPADVAAVNRALTYPLWDAGRDVGARVREPKDVVRILGRADEAAALLDARLLAGDEGLFADMRDDVLRRLERGRASFFAQLVEATAQRHARFGDAGHLLEPNIRDSAGGLRDVQTLEWASKLLPGSAGGVDGLVAAGFLSRLDADLVGGARTYLSEARVRLHLLTGRRQDQLYLADQDAIAAALGYESREDRPPADEFMQRLYVHARHVDAVSASFWDRMTRRRPRRAWRSSPTRAVGDGCVVRDGHLEVVAVTGPRDDPAAWLRVFLRAIREGVHVGRASLNRLQTSLGVEPLAWSPEARDAFTELLQSSDASPALEAMDATGFLAALIPEWTGVRCLPQRDLYHLFTVDMHLFETAAELASSRACDETLVRDAWSRVASSAPLFVAALLHDIGKGRGGDHSAIGARVARDVGVRMGLPAADVDDVAFLVERHLALASLATRRDLNEPRTIASAAAQAGTASRLAMLYLLTRADSKATGPEAWTTFRAALVGELYAKTMALLEGRPAAAGTERPRPEDALLSSPLSDGDVRTMVAERDDVHEFVLVARDRPGLFASVCAVLALRGVDVHDAEIYTREDGVAVEVFRVTGSHGEIPKERWDRVVRDLESLFGGALDLEDALSRKAGQERHRRPAHKRGGRVRVVVDNDASPTHTVVEVHAPDHLGLLHEVTKALYRASCDVSVAKIATYGADVVDVFYVRDLQGGRITSPEQVARLEAALRAASAR